MREVDCAIVGAGPAGLSAAVNLARMRRSVIVVDDRDGRSLWGQTNRNYLGFPNGIPAAEIRLAARKQAATYGTKFLGGQVTSVSRDGRLFRLWVESRPDGAQPEKAGRRVNVERDLEVGASLGEEVALLPEDLLAKTLILATGVRDNFPRFPGWAECVGRSLYWCLQCDGYESVGRNVAVVGHDEDSAEQALELLDFTDRITFVAGRNEGFDLSNQRLADVRDSGIATHPCGVSTYQNANGQIEALVLDDERRTRLPVEMVFVSRRPTPRNEMALVLGVEVNELGHVVVDSTAHTNVPGLYAAGDLTSLHDHQVSAAVHEGAQAAMAANYYLYRPVQRHPGSPEPR